MLNLLLMNNFNGKNSKQFDDHTRSLKCFSFCTAYHARALNLLVNRQDTPKIERYYNSTLSSMHVINRMKNAIHATIRAEVRRSVITTTVWDESQVTPQGCHR